MAQRDPLVEYQREGYDMFVGMHDGLEEEPVGFLFNVQVEATPAPAVAPVATPQGLADLAAQQQEPAPAPAPAALHAKGIDDESARQLTYSGPAEDGSAEVQRNGGGKHAAPAAGTTRKERREAARKQAKEGKTLRRG